MAVRAGEAVNVRMYVRGATICLSSTGVIYLPCFAIYHL
jgi:hypothetical protein